MRALIERVKSAKCIIDNSIHSEIGNGYLVYVAFEDKDTFDIIDKCVNKILKLRIFTDSNHKLNLSINEVYGSILLISSFSLFADLTTGNRPSFSRSSSFDKGKPLYDYTVTKFQSLIDTKSGIFGADMEINAINDGPISVILDI